MVKPLVDLRREWFHWNSFRKTWDRIQLRKFFCQKELTSQNGVRLLKPLKLYNAKIEPTALLTWVSNDSSKQNMERTAKDSFDVVSASRHHRLDQSFEYLFLHQAATFFLKRGCRVNVGVTPGVCVINLNWPQGVASFIFQKYGENANLVLFVS